MKAKVRQYSAGKWRVTDVSTAPLRIRSEVDGAEIPLEELKLWARALPPVLIDGKSTEFLTDPEGWLSRMARMNYTRITAEIIG